jgi:hypothetical protein
MFKIYPLLKYTKIAFVISILNILSGCIKSGYDEVTVYDSNFKSGSTEKLKGAILYKQQSEFFIGRYNNGGFSVNLDNLAPHKAIEITVETYMHDSWDGNNNYGGIDGPDVWTMSADGEVLVNSSFSNSPCNSMYCLFQSYPVSYSGGIINNPPKTDAMTVLPGFCYTGYTYGTSVYKIVKTISHSKNTLNINFKDFLVQTNVSDPLCDESWSVGLLRVKILNTTP